MKRRLVILLLLAATAGVSAQPDNKPELSGYVSDMASLIALQPAGEWMWENLLHNRLNAGWQFAPSWRVDAGLRNRLIAGNRGDKNLELRVAVDRLFVTFEKEKWKLQAGRQRINWGQTLVWNPNDIFNTYSFFDFDYVERPGCDAFRATYYHSPTASTELAASLDASHRRLTAALLHHWNHRNFDYQLMAGLYAESDLVVGGAWSGDFSGLNFRGELSFFQPLGHSRTASSRTIAASVGADYIFPSSLALQAEALYNNVGNAFSSNGLMGLYAAPLSAKYLSICDWNLFAQASYPLTPRLNSSVSTMYFVEIKSWYAGLSLDYFLIENLDLSFIVQYFSAPQTPAFADMQITLLFARLKYSF
ncbi:MAG: hypothetical protein LBQ78_00185 [Tannerellaceae bacterium]|jgi:hypothetical protein|nr:hypothetical protein [Tannerellaceae bacterium]